jgi:S1-C subfamily serine protease
MKEALTLATICALLTSAGAERATVAADATVFIRMVGSVHLDIDDGLARRSVDVEQVEIGTGSGFVISPHGYVLTNEHVVSSEQFLLSRGAQQVRVTLNVSAIQVCFREEVAARRGLASCMPANVVAADRTLDLAVLFVSGSDLPYIALGDSDVVSAGLPVDALGYPLGRETEVARVATALDFVPDVSVTPGAVSAVRADDAGDRRFLQITNSLNAGNSGGPVVTHDGFAVGVARMRLRNAAGIGFAIPINQVKDFLESHGLDQSLPARRLRLGGFHDFENKRIGLRLPEGYADTSRFHTRVETDGQAGDIVLRIDRVFSPWSVRQIEQTLIGTQTFEAAALTPRDTRTTLISASQVRLGGAVTSDAKLESRVDYALLDLGAEMLVARYVGPAESMAFNESVLRESLASLQGQSWRARTIQSPDKLEWAATSVIGSGSNGARRELAFPAGWTIADTGPSRCRGIPPPSMVAAAFPAEDFTLSLRAAVLSSDAGAPADNAVRCSTRRGSLGAASYVSRAEWLGVTYVIEGIFVPMPPDHIAQLEVSSTADNATAARALLAAWAKRVTP